LLFGVELARPADKRRSGTAGLAGDTLRTLSIVEKYQVTGSRTTRAAAVASFRVFISSSPFIALSNGSITVIIPVAAFLAHAQFPR
jgi:hypothetical protein